MYRPADRLAFVAAEIVDDDNVSWSQRGEQDLLGVGEECVAVDRSVDNAGGFDAIEAQCRQEGQSTPATVRRAGDQPLAPGATPVRAGHVGLGPSLVDEDQARGIKPPLVLLPLSAPSCHVGPSLLAGVQAFF